MRALTDTLRQTLAAAGGLSGGSLNDAQAAAVQRFRDAFAQRTSQYQADQSALRAIDDQTTGSQGGAGGLRGNAPMRRAIKR